MCDKAAGAERNMCSRRDLSALSEDLSPFIQPGIDETPRNGASFREHSQSETEQWTDGGGVRGMERDYERAYASAELPYAVEMVQDEEGLANGELERPASAEEDFAPSFALAVTPADWYEPAYVQPEEEAASLSGLRQRIVDIANEEWARWGRGVRIETDSGMHGVLAEYWETVLNAVAAKQAIRDGSPWSAAFISYVLRKAGAGNAFKYDTAHYAYVTAAKRARLKGDSSRFWAYDISAMRPELGDLVCRDRQAGGNCGGTTYGNVDDGKTRPTHSDIVTEVRSGSITVIGGNVVGPNCPRDKRGNRTGCTVNAKSIKLDAGGLVIPNQSTCRYFALVKSGGRESAASPPAASTTSLAHLQGHDNHVHFQIRPPIRQAGAVTAAGLTRSAVSEWLADTSLEPDTSAAKLTRETRNDEWVSANHEDEERLLSPWALASREPIL